MPQSWCRGGCGWTGSDRVGGMWRRRRGAWKDKKGKRGGHTMTYTKYLVEMGINWKNHLGIFDSNSFHISHILLHIHMSTQCYEVSYHKKSLNDFLTTSHFCCQQMPCHFSVCILCIFCFTYILFTSSVWILPAILSSRISMNKHTVV